VSLSGRLLVLLGSFVGLLLALVGVATSASPVVCGGVVVLPLSLIAGGVLLREENGIARAEMLIAAGLILAEVGAFGGLLSKLFQNSLQLSAISYQPQACAASAGLGQGEYGGGNASVGGSLP